MSRPLVGFLVVALATTSLTPPVGANAPALIADAGDSSSAPMGGIITVNGFAFGGDGSYSAAWSYAGDDARFADPSALGTTFDTTGLAPGTVALSLTVTDGVGATSSDTVLHAIAADVALVDQSGTILVGVPDEIMLSGLDGGTATYTFTVPSGAPSIAAILDWDDPEADLDLVLYTPDGIAANFDGATANKPETSTVNNPVAGIWTVEVQGFFVITPTDFDLVVTGPGVVSIPTSGTYGTYLFGSEDAQPLVGSIRGGTAPYTSGWDLDLDGVYEVSGETTMSAFAPGVHAPAFKITDADGFESRRVTTVTVLEDVDHVKRLGCARDPGLREIPMEYHASLGTCWMHIGHHTYYLDGVFTLVSGSGDVFAVEQINSPPKEIDADLVDPIHIQVSLDGASWTEIGTAQHDLLGAPRQKVDYTLGAHTEAFSYIRFSLPQSAAEGLSGFLDRSYADLLLNEAEGSTTAVTGITSLSCETDVMERFFVHHPCWFGGINRYDSPSVMHTYPLGSPVEVEGLTGLLALAPWRTDDWFLPIPPPFAQVTETNVNVLGSTDGVEWFEVAAFTVRFGVPQVFDILFDTPMEAQWLRFMPDHHPRSHDFDHDAPMHHVEAFIVHSEVSVTVVG